MTGEERIKEMLQISIYCVSSAVNLPEEPENYGPLRLMEIAERILSCVENEPNGSLKALIEEIKGKKSLVLSDPDEFTKFCEAVLTDLIAIRTKQ